MCRLLGVSRSGYYAWVERTLSRMQQRRDELSAAIQFIFDATHRADGYRRMHAELLRQGMSVDDELVRILMRVLGLVPVQGRRKRPDLARMLWLARYRT